MVEPAERWARRNAALIVLDMASFGVAVAFINTTVILPGVVRQLGGGPLAVGLLTTTQSGGWLLPQLIAGRYVANRPHVKKYVLVPAAISRGMWALAAPALSLSAVRSPRLALAMLLVALACLWVGDALASVPWFDLVGKTIPADRRGRVFGVGQAVSGLLGIGAGVLVARILARPAPFPANPVLLILLSCGCFGLSFLALAMMRETARATHGEAQPGWREYLPRLATILRAEPRFVWLIVVRWLGGFADMGAAFYVLYAADRLRLAGSVSGLFVSAGVAGSLLGGILLGPLGDRRGRPAVIAIILGLRTLCPALALVAPLAGRAHPLGSAVAMLALYAAAGMANGGNMVGFMSYVLEIAPAHERSTYMGLANTLGGLVLAAPLTASWLVRVASYELLFVASLGLAGLGLLAAWPGREWVARRQRLA